MLARILTCLILTVTGSGCAQKVEVERTPSGTQDWWSAAKRSISEDQRRAYPLADGEWALSTRDLHVVIGESGVHARGAGVSWRFDLVEVRRERGASVRSARAKPEAKEARVDLRRPGVTEWYVNLGDAVEQGFEIQRLDGEGDLIVEGRVQSGHPPVRFREGIRYGALSLTGLVTRDAAGRFLRTWFDAREDKLAFRVAAQDLRGVSWPVVVDPVLRVSPVWEYSPLSANVAGTPFNLGASVAGVGDVNCDGVFSDIVVGVPGFEIGAGSPDIGRAYVFFGSAAGLATTPGWQISAPLGGLLAGARFGASVAGAGDVNGDGCSDIVVGAPNLVASGQPQAGRVYVYYGGMGGPAGPTEIFAEPQSMAHFGASLAGAGDVDDDGYPDVAIGAPDYDGGATDSGRAYLFRGGPAGVSTLFAWSATPDPESGAHLGAALTGAGDVNGDGAADLVVGSPDHDAGDGSAYLFLGVPLGSLSAVPDLVLPDAAEVQAGARFGAALGSGDANGDGFSDVLVGAPDFDDTLLDAGRAFLYLGAASGLVLPAAWAMNPIGASGASFGAAVAGAGDVNGDALADFVVGSPGLAGEGGATLLLGDPAALLRDEVVPVSPQAGASIGSAVAGGGDVDGDGFGEILIGAATWDDVGVDGGRALLFYGGSPGLGLSTDAPDASFNPEPDADAYFGWSVASAGDVNGDGDGDVIVGAPNYDFTASDTGRAYVFLGGPSGLDSVPTWAQTPEPEAGALFGWAVASAGHVNDDAYADIIVGARDRDEGGFDDSGKVYVFHGGPAGPSVVADWEQAAPDAQDMGWFGAAVAGVGSVNADTYGDVIVGAPGSSLTVDPGRTYVFYGGSLGLGVSLVLAAPESQAGAQFGGAVAGAGDVNGDGLSDVIIGAQAYDGGAGFFDHGRAYVYEGAPGGMSTAPARVLTQPQAGARFGASVAGAGDVDGDGYSDVLIGASHHDAMVTDAGRAMLFRGGLLGIEPAPIWDVTVDPGMVLHFGQVVGTPGDANGDGLSDVAVGTELDWAYVFWGGATGPSLLPDLSYAGASGFGRSLAGADVNGDGFGDLIVGASTESVGGLLHVFHGNDETGGRQQLAQLDAADSPIRPGATSTTSVVNLEGVITNAAWLGARVSLEVEVRIVGEAFTGIATGISPPGVAGAGVRASVGPLPPGSYRWRARPVWPVARIGPPPSAPLGRGRWVDFGDNDPAQADFRVDWPLSLDNRGDPCTTNSMCFSHLCRDGICCTSSCEGPCKLCAGDDPDIDNCVGIETGADPQCDANPCFSGLCSRGECAVRLGVQCGDCLACDAFGACSVPITVGACAPDLGAPEADMGTPDLMPDEAAPDSALEPTPDQGVDSTTKTSATLHPFACDCAIGGPSRAPVAGVLVLAIGLWLLGRRRQRG